MQQVGLFIFPEVEVLDVTGPFEVLSVAKDADDHPFFQVHLIGETTAPIQARNRFTMQAHYTLDNHPPLDVLLVPGGFGIRAQLENPTVLHWLKTQAESTPLIGSICTGAWLLAQSGLLQHRPATTHQVGKDHLLTIDPTIQWRDERFVESPNRITSGGVSAGIDMALHLVERFAGPAVAQQTAKYLEYRVNP